VSKARKRSVGFASVVVSDSPQAVEGIRFTLPNGCAIEGISKNVELELGHNPFDGGLYVFTHRAHNKIKCLMWEDNGFVLYDKSLAEERFKWSKPDDEVISLTGIQINGLLDGYDLA
jgi:transposase